MLITREAPTGRVGVPGTLRCAPTRARTVAGDPDETVLPAPMAMEVGPTGRADVVLAATGPSWCWHVSWRSAAGSWDEWVAVPDSPSPIDWTDLPRVDPATLAPTAAPEAAWWAVADSTVSTGVVVGDDLILTRTDGTTTNAGTVRGADGPPGPPNALSIGTVTTGAPGSQAAATITGTAPAQTLSLTIPTGSPTAYELRGTGMPNGVVAASPGTYYTDVAGTCGAWRWLKTGGTDSTGWVVVVGDTGRRNISSLLHADWALSSSAGCLYLQRVGEMIYLEGRLRRVTASGARSSYTTGRLTATALPAGFTATSASIPLSSSATVAAAVGFLHTYIAANILGVAFRADGTTWTAVDEVSFSGSYRTADPWPTALPGVAA